MGDLDSVPVLGRSAGEGNEGMATHCSKTRSYLDKKVSVFQISENTNASWDLFFYLLSVTYISK